MNKSLKQVVIESGINNALKMELNVTMQPLLEVRKVLLHRSSLSWNRWLAYGQVPYIAQKSCFGSSDATRRVRKQSIREDKKQIDNHIWCA